MSRGLRGGGTCMVEYSKQRSGPHEAMDRALDLIEDQERLVLLKDLILRVEQMHEVAERMAQALWVCVEHNRLHFGESHNTVIDGGAVLAEWEALK